MRFLSILRPGPVLLSCVLAIVSCIVFGTDARAQSGDATEGEQTFKKCRACHMIGDGARNLVGPVLTNVLGRPAGTAPGYTYSALNKAAGNAGLVWTEDNVFVYLADPSGFLRKFLTDKGKADQASGATKMPFRLKDEDERRNVIAYLRKFSTKK